MRLIAGNAYGLKNNVKTHSPLFYLHVQLDKGASFGLPEGYTERAIYIVKGSLEIAGRIHLPPNDDKEFIPLPEVKSKPSAMPPQPEPLS